MGDERMYFHNDSELGISRNDDDEQNKARHIARYIFAREKIKDGGIVLDCACGSGYGSQILSKKAKKVVGVDVDSKTILYAKKHYTSSNIDFIKEDLHNIDFADNTFDNVVSLETIEHIPEAKPFLIKIKNLLKKGGVVIVSSPMLRYKDGKPYITNPYHINEMPRDEFLSLTNEVFGDSCEYFAQHQEAFTPLKDESTGFCIAVCKNQDS